MFSKPPIGPYEARAEKPVQRLIRRSLTRLFRLRYCVRVQGLKNVPGTGGVLLLGNHVSWIDWAIVQIGCPRRVRFVVARAQYDKWYLRPLFDLMDCIPIQPGATSRATLEIVTSALDRGQVVCLFPEGVITRTGHLSEFRRGYQSAATATCTDVVIVPFYLRGLWGSRFSKSSRDLKRRRAAGLRRTVTVSFGMPLPKDTEADVLKRRIMDLSIASWQAYADSLPTIPRAWVRSVGRARGQLAIFDPVAGELSGATALTGAICLSRRLTDLRERNLGIVLPSSAAGALVNMAVLLAGKTAVNLNFTASDSALSFAIGQAGLETILTSRQFVDRLARRGRDIAPVLEAANTIYVEDLRAEIGRLERMATWLAVRVLPTAALERYASAATDAEATAVILFSSGSEGRPKGVMLSHRNILVNAHQVIDALDVQRDDVVLASLPLFHAFGLNAMLFMPLVMGIPIVCHPDPTDVAGIAKAAAARGATILCSTSSFLRMYTRHPRIEPAMLSSLRLVIAGAERLSPFVRDAFFRRFGVPVLEGYGCTETAPVAGANLPDIVEAGERPGQHGSKPGTIGMPVHGTSFRIVDPEAFTELATDREGMILIAGPQLMQGYLNERERTAAALRFIDGIRWFVTGDKGSLDADGFLTIRDRYSRFAKIAGEMVSLGEIERAVHACLGEQEVELVAVSLPDERKGEIVIVLHEGALDARNLEQRLLAAGLPGIMVPSRFVAIDSVPRLGAGKTDFVAARALAMAALECVDLPRRPG